MPGGKSTPEVETRHVAVPGGKSKSIRIHSFRSESHQSIGHLRSVSLSVSCIHAAADSAIFAGQWWVKYFFKGILTACDSRAIQIVFTYLFTYSFSNVYPPREFLTGVDLVSEIFSPKFATEIIRWWCHQRRHKAGINYPWGPYRNTL